MMKIWIAVCLLLISPSHLLQAQEPTPAWRVGFTEMRTNLPGGRLPNIATMRAMWITHEHREPVPLAPDLIDGSHVWTQFAGWEPQGSRAIVLRGWEDPDNAAWEEEHRTFRFTKEAWKLDIYLVDTMNGKVSCLTDSERVSHYNSGLIFLADGKLGFTALIDGQSKPFVMNADGSDKKPISQDNSGFIYGYSGSPDGSKLSYHDNYQVYIANRDGSDRIRIETGNPFNFGPRWSRDSQWLLFLSGIHHRSNPTMADRNGVQVQRIADVHGYSNSMLFLDVPDFHDGSSDLPIWSTDGASVFYTGYADAEAARSNTVEIFSVERGIAGSLNTPKQRTHSAPGTLHYHLQAASDSQHLLYGSKRNGCRQLFLRHLETGKETPLTQPREGYAAMWGEIDLD